MSRRNQSGFIDDLFNFSKRDIAFHFNATVLTGNALNRTANSNQTFTSLVYQNTAANGDSFTNGFELRPGTYTFSVLGVKANNAGIIDWYLDDALIVSQQDWYNVAAAVYNQILTATVSVVNAAKYHTLKGVVNGKNASSSDYFMLLTAYWMAQASD